MKKQEAANLIKLLNHAWPQKGLDTEGAVIMLSYFRDLPYDLTRDVIDKLVLSSRFRPTIADIRLGVAKCLGLLPPPVDEATRAAAVYVEAQEQLQYVNGSGYRPPPADPIHPLIAQVLKGVNTSGEHWMTQFQKAYAGALNERVTETLTHRLTDGQHQLEAGE